MPRSHCWYIAIQIYLWWNCRRNPFTQLSLIYVSQDASLDIQNGLHTVRWFSGAPECWLPATKLETWPSGWRIPLWTTSGLSKWHHQSLPWADSQHGLYQQYSKGWLQSQYGIDRPEIAHACRRSCLLPHKPLLLQQSLFDQVFWRICFWDRLP